MRVWASLANSSAPYRADVPLTRVLARAQLVLHGLHFGLQFELPEHHERACAHTRSPEQLDRVLPGLFALCELRALFAANADASEPRR